MFYIFNFTGLLMKFVITRAEIKYDKLISETVEI